MPWSEHASVLDRELSKAEARDAIAVAQRLLRDLVNYATNAFVRCVEEVKKNPEDNLAVLILYIHLIEMTDGVQVLVSEACATPATPLLRSSFETLLAIKFILESNVREDYLLRSRSWLAYYARERLNALEMLDPSTQRGQERQRIWSQDDTLPDMPLPEFAIQELQREEDYLRNLLASPEYQAIEVNYREFRRTHNRKKPSWYQLAAWPRTPGEPIPTNLEELARWLKMAQQYDKLLRYWVSLAHGYEVRRFFDKGAVETPTARPLRKATQVRTVTLAAATMLLEATRRILERYRPGEDYRTWYLTEIRDHMHEIFRYPRAP